MAGDWIKMRASLCTHPKVGLIAEIVGESTEIGRRLTTGFNGCLDSIVTRDVTRDVTIASLLRVWCATNEHTRDGVWEHATLRSIDAAAGIPGFGEAMQLADWLIFDEEACTVTMPNFLEYNSPAKGGARTPGASRQKKYRDKQKAGNASDRDANSDVTRDVTVTHREEKRREEKKEDTPQPPQAGEGGGDVQSPSKAGLICRAIKSKGVPGVSPSNPELLALIEKGVPVETFEAAAEVCAKSKPPKGLGYLLAIVKRQITEAAVIADGPGAQAADPDSRSAIEAEGVAKGIGPWNEINEQWHVYKARVRGRQSSGLNLDALAAMAAQRSQAGAH